MKVPKNTISGHEYPVEKIFSNDFVFRIPPYQRPYSWTTEHAGALIEDLSDALEDSIDVEQLNPYFLGSVVLIKGDSPDSQVVDGQQRLTTLTILLAALRASVDAEVATDIVHYLYEKGSLVTKTHDRYRLALRERDADFFRDNVQVEGGINKLRTMDPLSLTAPQKRIRENAILFLDTIDKLPPSRRVQLAQFIINNCFMVVVSTPDLGSAYRIFTVLNDRGMDLSHADILKAKVLGELPEGEIRDRYQEKWEGLEENLGTDAFQSLFGHIRMIFRKVKAKGTVLEEYERYIHPEADPTKFVDSTLIPYGEASYEIRNASYQSTARAEEINRLFRWLNSIDNSDWLPPATLFLARYRSEPTVLETFFTDLERLAAYLMLRRVNINGRIERYGRLLAEIESGTDLQAATSALQLTDVERSEFLSILNGDIYWERGVRYVLLRLDEALSTGDATYKYPRISIEHVLPQNPPAASEWLKWFPDQTQRAVFTNKLANLVLLNRITNSKAQNFDFDRKKREYFATAGSVSPFAITSQVIDKQIWTPMVLEQRQHEHIGRLKLLWRL